MHVLSSDGDEAGLNHNLVVNFRKTTTQHPRTKIHKPAIIAIWGYGIVPAAMLLTESIAKLSGLMWAITLSHPGITS